jgi:hypothetical protein
MEQCRTKRCDLAVEVFGLYLALAVDLDIRRRQDDTVTVVADDRLYSDDALAPLPQLALQGTVGFDLGFLYTA